MADMQRLAEEAQKVLATHGIGAGGPPKNPELWQQFRQTAQTEEVSLTVENRFYEGYSHAEIDWAKPVHAMFLDFKGDGMQLGHVLEQLERRGAQYVFVGNPLPFNGGWHFTAMNDFEHPLEQTQLDPSWLNKRIWHRVNYVPSVTEAGEPALTPREKFAADKIHDGAIAISDTFKFTSIIFIGGLMPHTLNATAVTENSPASNVIAKHFGMRTTFAAIGHGLDVLIACGTKEKSIISGFTASVFPRQDHLLQISGIAKSDDLVCRYEHSSGAVLVSASYWGMATRTSWFEKVGFSDVPSGGPPDGCKKEAFYASTTSELVLRLDVSKLPGIVGSKFAASDASAPTVAVFVDNVADPIEAYTIVAHLMSEGFNFQMISRSLDESKEGKLEIRQVTSETVFGNAMYGLKDCACTLPTTPANLVPSGTKFDGFFVAGGQCPYHMFGDAHIIALMNDASVAAAVCHGPELLIGSKWLDPADEKGGNFISYYGAWMSFRHVIHRYEKKKPGETCEDATGRLFTGNAPNSTKEMVVKACAAMKSLKGA
eukprot:TRINITY_DN16994_c0_g1_i2.p1 TRINITY_DN16994_c0_g1~~TRINITY_DN16994_c0_g1_i2.p1  ORF type:complete len:550 (+),score=90.35 TRINITY_DN16994_c0_g1_i2:23-1651(+)